MASLTGPALATAALPDEALDGSELATSVDFWGPLLEAAEPAVLGTGAVAAAVAGGAACGTLADDVPGAGSVAFLLAGSRIAARSNPSRAVIAAIATEVAPSHSRAMLQAR